MAQNIILYHTLSDSDQPALLFAGEMAVGVGPNFNRMWVGDGTENRLFLSDNPTDTSLFGGPFLPLSGGVITGQVAINGAAADTLLVVGGRGITYSALGAIGANISFGYTGGILYPFINGAAAAGLLPLSGGVLTGALALASDPTNPTQAATKNYVDTTAAANTSIIRQNDGRNFFDNPFFQIAQRGPGPFSTTGTTGLDRYAQVAAGGDTMTVTQIALTDADRTAIGDERAIQGLQAVFVGSAGGNCDVIQRIENVFRLSNQTVTVSFYAKATSGTPAMAVGWQQTFGGGGSSPNVVGNGGVTPPLGPNFQRYSITFALPTADGKIIGTANANLTAIQFFFSNGGGSVGGGTIGQQAGTVVLWGLQLEINSAATYLEPRDPATDLARCQRYLANLHGQSIATLPAGANFSIAVWFPVQQRSVPPGFVPNSQLTVNSSTNVTNPRLYGLATNDSAVVEVTATAEGDTIIDFNILAQSDL